MDVDPEAGERPLPVVGMVIVDIPEPREQYHPEMVTAMREVVDAHPLFWELVAAARQAEPTSFHLDRDWLNSTNDLNILGGLRATARWLSLRAALAEAENDSEAFTQAILDILVLANTIPEGSGAITELVRISLDAMAGHALIQGLSRIELDTEQLDRLIDAVDQHRQSHPIDQVFGNIISDEFHLITRDVPGYIMRSEAQQAQFNRESEMFGEEPEEIWFELPKPKSTLSILWHNLLLVSCPGRYELRHAETMDLALSNYDQFAALKEKPGERWAWLSRQDQEFEDQDISIYDVRSMRTLSLIHAARAMIRGKCSLAVTAAALRAERYRVEHGDWPATLTDATGETPTDARGEPILYRATPDGVVIYNTGSNTLDEQGYSSQGVEDPAYPDPDDHAAWLYHPAARNTLPPPPFDPQPLEW